MTDRSMRALALGLTLTVAACGGSDVTGVEEEDGQPPVENPSFATDVNPIFVARGCTAGNCHGGGADDLTLTSSPAVSYLNLVDVRSSSDPAFLRVEADDAQNSYLVMKLEGRAGSRMPIGGPPLSTGQIGTIRNWIDAGAADN